MIGLATLIILLNRIVLHGIVMKRGPQSQQKALDKQVLRLLQEKKNGVHFSAIQKELKVGSPNTLSRSLKALVNRGALKIKRQQAPGIPRAIYYLADPLKTGFELERNEIIQRILAAPFETADQVKSMVEEIDRLRFAVRMLQDASGLKVINAGKGVLEHSSTSDLYKSGKKPRDT